MAGLQPPLQYRWNLGGWGNSRSQVESWGGQAGANSTHTINTGEWYEIKIVNTPTDYTLYLNGEEVATVEDDTQDGVGRIGLATWSTTARFDDVMVYGPQGPTGVDHKGKTTTTWGNIKFKLAP
ncbi:MAG: family 16 glycoside hydrolase [Candidatus Poribacteria bacterium]